MTSNAHETALNALGERDAVRLGLIARHWLSKAGLWSFEAAFWQAVKHAAELAERRRIVSYPRWASFAMPSFADLPPDRVEAEAIPVLAALGSIRDDVAQGDAMRDWAAAAQAAVCEARDAARASLAEPNPFELAFYGGEVIAREGPEAA